MGKVRQAALMAAAFFGVLLSAGRSHASLRGDLEAMANEIDENLLYVGTAPRDETDPANFDHVGSFAERANEVGTVPNETQTRAIAEAAPFSLDIPATATAPAFTYTYNPALGVFERSSASLGPIFADRAETSGAGRFSVGVYYLYDNFTSLNGESLDSGNKVFHHFDHSVGGPNGSGTDNSLDQIRVTYDKFDLTSHVFSFFGTYGITDRWDVNMVMPLIWTKLDVVERAQMENRGGDHVFMNQDNRTPDPNGKSARLIPLKFTTVRPHEVIGAVSGDAFGVGDILLRTKYRLADMNGVSMAVGGGVRMPSGEADNFQGQGDVSAGPFLIASKGIGPHEVHANGGLDFDLEKVGRSRLRYAIGGSYKVLDRLAVLLDIVGSSGFTSETIQTHGPNITVLYSNLTKQTFKAVGSEKLPRTDIVNAMVGAKFSVMENAIGFVGALVPITDDGLRPDVTPTAGFEWDF